MELSGPLRPVPIYCRRPLELQLSPSNCYLRPRIETPPSSAEGIDNSVGSSDKAKQSRLPAHELPGPPSLFPLPPEIADRNTLGSQFGKLRELLPSEKNNVSLITPVRGPDLRIVSQYQSWLPMLRHHPAYHQLLETFLVSSLPPWLCHPATTLCNTPFTFCAGRLPVLTSPSEDERCAVQADHGRQKESPIRAHAQNSDCSSLPREGKSSPAAAVSAEDLVSSITAVPDPYQQYGYGRKLFPCSQCRYTTDRRNNLKRHMLTMHQLSAKLLECCGVLFRTKAALREHALIFHYHGYTCFYCGRRFCRKALLKRHLSVHNGQKEFICNVCDYATSHKSNLERHRRVHMRQDDDPSCAEETLSEVRREVTEDEISVCSNEEEINVHSD